MASSPSVRELKESHRQVFLPLGDSPGEVQLDYGFAHVVLNGETIQVALFVKTLPSSDAIYMQAFLDRKEMLPCHEFRATLATLDRH